MKALAIQGSPRNIRSTTRRLVSLVLEAIEGEGVETEIIDLCELRIIPCTACEGCSLTGRCVFEDDFSSVARRVADADIIILASPVYIDNVSGQMKVFFDRLADAIHYQVFSGKTGCSVVTTHTSGGDEVLSYLNHVLNYLGVMTVGGLSIATGGDTSAVETVREQAISLGKRLVAAAQLGYHDPRQEADMEANRNFFRDIVLENRDLRPDDYYRWVRMGWIRDADE